MSLSGDILIKNPEIIPKMLELLDLILKNEPGSRNAHDEYYYNKSSYVKNCALGKRSVSLINECLLNHRFDEAAKMLWIMSQDRSCFDLVLYKGIMAVLENISNYDDETVKTFSSNFRHLKYTNKMEIQLEYLIYALKNNIADQDYSLPSKRNVGNIKKIPYIDQLYSAYSALVNYITWVNTSQDDFSSKSENAIAFSTIDSFKQLIKNPGVWDIFVLKLVEMLEYYEKYDEIEEALKSYVERNPGHVNAYIYICVHLYKHPNSANPNSFIHYAKKIFDICPSDERVLLLVQKWNEMGKHLKERLKMLFMFLDYPSNGKQVLGWQLLSSHLQQAVRSEKLSTMTFVRSAWKLRCHAWKSMYFTSINIGLEAFDLVCCRVKVLSVLDSNHEYIKKVHAKYPNIDKHLQMPCEVP